MPTTSCRRPTRNPRPSPTPRTAHADAGVAGQGGLDEHDLEADAPPIYIQEKIDPRVLVENLRKTAKADETEPELTLFETFDGLKGLDLVEFDEHEANWSNRMILGDSLQVMASSTAASGSRQGPDDLRRFAVRHQVGSNWQVAPASGT